MSDVVHFHWSHHSFIFVLFSFFSLLGLCFCALSLCTFVYLFVCWSIACVPSYDFACGKCGSSCDDDCMHGHRFLSSIVASCIFSFFFVFSLLYFVSQLFCNQQFILLCIVCLFLYENVVLTAFNACRHLSFTNVFR